MITVIGMSAPGVFLPPPATALGLHGADTLLATLALVAIVGAAVLVSLAARATSTERTSRDDGGGARTSHRLAA